MPLEDIKGFGSLIIPEKLKRKFRLCVDKKYTIGMYLRKAKSCEKETILRFIGEPDPSHYYIGWRGVIFEIVNENNVRRLADLIFAPWQQPRKSEQSSDEEPEARIEKPKEKASLLDDDKVIFSDHALEQLAARYKFYGEKKLSCPEATARQLLKEAVEKDAISKDGAVRRLIDNDFEEVRYFKNGKWRFVIREEEDGTYLVKTIEYAYLK